MPPRLDARTMFWSGIGLAVGTALVQNVGLAHLTYAFSGTWFVGLLLTVLQIGFTGGIVLAGGSFVVRALQPDDDATRRSAARSPWEDRDNRLS
ncbi:hypothetical protein [Cellulosimicrobium composti]|uniref:Uncharacterized protein n=1 Tax=Cellulosimicrobium composti TaxID=2672572 RepID=A0ABX0BB55_9MICO|nr:hypothetical protein [Cellulosimicrobium composti]NDO88189.1 hypothetical protein [Cellulosimicrobium composti]